MTCFKPQIPLYIHENSRAKPACDLTQVEDMLLHQVKLLAGIFKTS